MKLDDSSSTRKCRLANIWAIVEAREVSSSMIVIASATTTDDTPAVARGLAEAAHAAGRRTGYLQLAKETQVGAQRAQYAHLSITDRMSEREGFDAALAGWRAMYDVIIVDAADLQNRLLGAHVARVADGVVIGVCAQRRVMTADRELATLLSLLNASVIGAVMTPSPEKAATVQVSLDRARLKPAAQP